MLTETSANLQSSADKRRILSPENLDNQVAKFASRRLTFKVEVDREVYYGNDRVSGLITVKSDRAVRLQAMKVMVTCRMRYRYDNAFSICTIYSEKKTIGQNHDIERGRNTIPFAFILPAELLSSLEHKLVNVSWDVRLALCECEGAACLDTVAYTRFQVSSLYYSNFLTPRSQGEVNSHANNSVSLRAEASLEKDIHAVGEPVHCIVRILNLGANTKVRRIKATLRQQVTSKYKTKQMKRKADIDSAVLSHPDRRLHGTASAADKNAHTSNFSLGLFADAPKDSSSRIAVQRHGDGLLHLTPSTCVLSTDDHPSLAVSYCVDVRIETNTSEDLVLSVPFTLQGSTTQAALPTEYMEECVTFALTTDYPPLYEEYAWMSKSSFSSDALARRKLSDANSTDIRSPFCIPGSPHFLRNFRLYSRGKNLPDPKRSTNCGIENGVLSTPVLISNYKLPSC